ncbi:Gfo/Idh/MocA family oxidoreductase [Ponticoccus sp. SC2-23]|uniref:Gfo/Idh/MocA family oxidoreductase n=1 Tax=Alexandriicola marinus TaxID=2081710 RepID=UPI000FDAA806|nr:Gfo/Idh/MocA family oxidoreductase [Alexandriicola marinus]MBM1221131.1 Gfo/Idh/MocA family oxidoreductase [Ponticoccus sp. SC6-9]MBM1225701.1 Gfo/Idh/MocA family oxidoreductase [Ponticoccus sp. SC6-15]MBM1227853.1 Gfo/Idh/MocA family oxidoreductase [Ponticoccus sp. SC6-38]MBM1234509.1 Gfo/Idh/MocA family oxidoreductase [Ponticoccus sp. SC6-45]MBM1238355.1 Gfo/Idh/MocA family oxidoreductase [Ponticoccus sp. SC6-49]MBM1243624.1 Gfo/Idh/MocA family oxidoreductase [Ponticoccus sp. SC2-64]MBM
MVTFPLGDRPLKLAMLGMTEGNGHPYSWSIIVNGSYDADALAGCPYAVIRDYIAKQPPGTLGIAGAQVTHVWTDDPADAVQVAAVAHIPNIAERAEDVIGEVDAVLIATDIGHQHVDRARSFVEAGLPVFIDKPLCDNRADLAQFSDWVAAGHPILSSSAMRYAKEFAPYHRRTHEFGALRHINMTMAKKWETYGIHALETILPITGPGFETIRNFGSAERNIVHLTHRDGIDVTISVIKDQIGGAGFLTIAGTQGGVQLRSQDTYHAFKTQLEGVVSWLRTGTPPVPWPETQELMKLVIGGIESREQGGKVIHINEIEVTQ